VKESKGEIREPVVGVAWFFASLRATDDCGGHHRENAARAARDR